MHSNQDKFKIFNSLTGIVVGLEGEYTTIDLRNEAIVTGKIESVDGMMNINMEDVTFYDARGVKQSFETFFVNARTIRHVHIPNNLTPEELFSRQQMKMSRVITKEKPTFKKVRAQRKNAETVREAFK
ncbi:U7 snRNA-associated Sm-like protein LSm10 [Coccinella septempunctata]|uniref:U7 snRNA-associated Sm-like protein LSm10 n=1 Tax=Coccinella septempunctata TaxID=41139 RepID=UPI001D06A0A5|nr:U7 snRNA-associated Sm-like protein LSm10 [Coccinella septempunctata]